MVNKGVWNAVLGCNLKNHRMNSICFQGKPFSITVIQVYAPTTNAKKAKVEQFFLWWPTRPSRTNTKKGCPFHHRGLEGKSRKSRDTWSNGKFGLGVQNEAGQRLKEFSQENALVIVNTLFQQHKTGLYTWTSQMVNTEIRWVTLFAAKDEEVLYSQQKQDQELTVAQIINSLLPNSDLNWRKKGKPLDHLGMT